MSVFIFIITSQYMLSKVTINIIEVFSFCTLPHVKRRDTITMYIYHYICWVQQVFNTNLTAVPRPESL